MSDRSDYDKTRTNINELLPDVYHSDTSRVFFENTVNRYLSKKDMERVVGTIGDVNRADPTDTRVQEVTPHRKAFQLQPLMRATVATVEHIMSFVDVLNELERLGVDISRMKKWGDSLGFNFIPPITLDKLINYRDYFWYDETNPNSVPQYITIENYVTTAEARLSQKQQEIATFGQQHPISNISLTENAFVTSSDLSFLRQGAKFTTTSSSLYNNDVWTVEESSTFQNGVTVIVVQEPLTNGNGIIDGVINFSVQIQDLSDDLNCLSEVPGYTGPCIVEQEHNDWSRDNKWVHKADLPAGVISLAKRANLPIIEYHPGLQLNEWSFTNHKWYFRANSTEPFEEVDMQPTDADLTDPDFLEKWVYIESSNPVPVDHQVELPDTDPLYNSLQVGSGLSTIDNITYTFDASGQGVALTGENHIRVYVDGVRMYGTYYEIDDGNGFVTGITFTTLVTDPVEVIVSPAAEADKNRQLVNVRTVLDDTQYQFDVISGDQPVQQTLIRYRKIEQVKEEGEIKYPLFDVFLVTGETAHEASPLFMFQEDPTYTISPDVGKRLKVTNDGRNYFFKQQLVEPRTNRIFAFKDSQSITAANPEGLQTIWRKGLNNETYVPKWVDENNNEVPQTEEGFWEIPNQLFFNVSHENREELSLAELTTHFNTINANQQTPPVFFKQDNFAHRLLYDLNYGVGGTIKEYNDSYDLFLSTIFDKNTNVIDIIEFAKQQYLSLQNSIREQLTKSMLDYLLNDSNEFMNDFYGSISEDVINKYENSDINSLIYGDSHTYDSSTNNGIKNWIITLPFVEMVFKEYPHVLIDLKRGIKELNHHDGHFNSLLLNQRNVNNFKKNIIKQELFPGRLRGWTDVIPADGGTPVVRSSVDWQRLLKNDYWLEGSDLYKFNIVSFSATAPSLSFNIGSYWLRSTDGMLFVRNTIDPSGWGIVNGVAGDVSAAWKLIDFDELILIVLQNIESQLFDAAPSFSELKCVESDYVLDLEDEILFDQLQREYFLSYTRELNIINPEGTDFVLTDPFTWNYKDVVYDNGVTVFRPNVDTVGEWGNRWYSINEAVFSTPYPHLQPWKLQGYSDKPLWWDSEYKDPSNQRRWLPNMWVNIQSGIVPTGYPLPSGAVPTYSFVSVNTTSTTYGSYNPDDLLPPFDGNLIGTPLESQLFIRNISAINFSTIGDSYPFGENGPIEWMYRKSVDYLYNQLKIIYRMQPLKFVHKLWGNRTTEVADLVIDLDQQKVLSHLDMAFHGDLIDDQVFKLNGLGQWYINYIRINNLDAKTSDFRELWTNWQAQLGYQFNSFIDPRSFKSFTQNFNLTDNDRTILVKKSPAARDYWVDSVTVTVSTFGDSILKNGVKVPKTKGYDWEFLIDTTVPTSRDISYYDVKNYNIQLIQPSNGVFQVVGVSLPWETGDVIYFDTSGRLPIPLTPDPSQIHQTEVASLERGTPYYIQVLTSTTFRIASSNENLQNLNFINFYDAGEGELFVYEPSSNFFAYAKANSVSLWYHNDVNKQQVNVVKMPIVVRGVQRVIDFIDGYSSYLYDQGFRFNDSERLEIDPNTGLFVNWQTEIERLIDGIYTGLGLGNTTSAYTGKTYNFTSAFATDVINSSLNERVIETGQKVFLFTTGSLPAPLQQNVEYYLVLTGSPNQFKLASTLENALTGLTIDITNDGVGQHSLGIFEDNRFEAERRIEVNPFRNNLWYSPEKGIVSNSIDGPYEDIKVNKTIYDQYGRPFDRKNLLFFREDKITRFKITDDIVNDVVPNVNAFTNEVDEYNYIHISGMHLFLDDYEHVVMFEDYSVGDYLIYDGFVGLRTPRFYVEFEKQKQLVSRPSVGGFVLDGDQLNRNLEASISDMQLYYDTNLVSEASPFIKYARDVLGYTNPTFLDRVSASEKTKFLFWKGMIQQKGSLNAVKAFINSVRFEDARVDEFWAYRIAEYGDRQFRNYPSLNVSVSDAKRGDIRFHFTNADDPTVEQSFVEITFEDQQRWLNLPDVIINSDGSENLKFEGELSSVQDYQVATPLTSDVYVELDVICDGVHVISQTLSDIDNTNKYLQEGTHYEQINAKIIKLVANEINNFMTSNGLVNELFKIYTINPSYYNLNPSKLIDNISKTVITDISVWDPARNYYSYDVFNDVDLVHYGDPVSFPASGLDVDRYNWTENKRHTIWLDTSTLSYKSYYDNNIMADINEQMGKWANLADWSSYDVYVWTKSTVPPPQYEALVAQQENDILLEETERASGIAYQPLWKYDENILPVVEFEPVNKRIRVDTSSLSGEFTNGEHIVVRFSPDNDGKYTINNVIPQNPTIVDLIVDEDLTSATLGLSTVFFGWRKIEPGELIEDFYEANRGQAGITHKFDNGATVDVYINGEFATSGTVNVSDVPTYSSIISPGIADRVTIVQTPTENEIEVGLFKNDFDFITKDVPSPSGIGTDTIYYFWVKDRALKSKGHTFSAREISRRLKEFGKPHQFFRSLIKVEGSDFNKSYYTQHLVRDVDNLINDNNRYIIRYTKDFSLRDVKADSILSQKNIHEEWKLFREKQPQIIPRDLWNKLVDSVSGLDTSELDQGNVVAVPSLDRVLYDQINNTTTRFGLRTGQTLIDKTRGLEIIFQTILLDDFITYPIDKFTFTEEADLSTPESIRSVIEFIYNNFPTESVNRIFFSVLREALSAKIEYADIIKTSMLALHGIRVLQVVGGDSL